MKNKKILCQFEKLLSLQVWHPIQLGRWLTKQLSHATEHLPDKEESTYKVFKNLLATLYLSKKSKRFKKSISSMLEFLSTNKNNWTTFLDNLSSFQSQNTLHIQLLQILLQESISREKAWRPFWTPAYKDASEILLLPTKIDSADSDSTLFNNWLPKQVEELSSLKIAQTKLQNKNLQKTFSQSFMSSLVDKWEKEVIPVVKLKTLKIKIYPNRDQIIILDEFINTSRYVYNRTLEYINNGHKVNFMKLRDLLVTGNTKKGHEEYKAFDLRIKELHDQKTKGDPEQINKEIKALQKERRDLMKNYDSVKNPLIRDFELKTPKDIRANAVKRCCDAFTTGFSNLKKGHIKHFKLKYKKKSEKIQSIELTPKNIYIKNEKINILPETFGINCVLKTHKPLKNITIKNNVDIIRKKNEYWVHISVPTEPISQTSLERIAGVDPGVRTFATVYSYDKENIKIVEYQHKIEVLKNLNRKLTILKDKRIPKRKRRRKKHFNKIEKRKEDLVDNLHWDFINHLLKNNDVVYYGDIKSHDIVKNGKNRVLNQAFNDLKFYQLKQRLLYKAYIYGKKVIVVPEHYTTKTCSCCGTINNTVGSKEVFTCGNCDTITGRDMNASKNMILKGMFS